MITKKFEELKQSGALPSPSGVGLVILRLTQDEECPIEDLVQCVQIDPGLTGRLLKLANSATWQGVVPVTTVHQGATRMGTRAVRGVALSFTLVSTHRTGACAGFDYDRYWSHSLACAAAAQILAGERGVIDPTEAFTCALLARIGMLALAAVHPDAYTEILLDQRGRSVADLLATESRAFDIHHWEVAAAMMADWGLPEFYSSAVLTLGWPPRDMSSEDPLTTAMADVLRDASLVADKLIGLMSDHEWKLGATWTDALAAVGSTHDPRADLERLRPVCEQASLPWQEWGTLFRIPTASLPAGSDTAGCTSDAILDEVAATRDVSVVRAELPSRADVEPGLAVSGESRDDCAPLPTGEVKILAIDDDPRIVRLLSHHLKGAGYQVFTARDGDEGLRIALEQSPHIVVTDWIMPQLSGIDLCRALRRTEAGRKVYVLILTGRDDEQQIVDAFAAGADDYVTKPFNARILLARVQAGQRLIELQRQVEADKKLRMRQVAEMGLLTRKLRAAANTDVLTELPNRRYALMRLEQEWAAAVRMNRPLSVVMADIDHFKQINDEHGHGVGDAVLRSTAAALRSRTRRGDVVCRVGGEEFLVINVNSGLSGAELCAERLRIAVETNFIECPGFNGRVTISLGCAERTPSMRNLDDLLKVADEAVYAAKNAGRNAVRTPLRRLPEAG